MEIKIQIPIYKGASEALIERSLVNNNFHGVNGMGNVDFWTPEHPTNENELVRPESGVQIIRDLVMQVMVNNEQWHWIEADLWND